MLQQLTKLPRKSRGAIAVEEVLALITLLDKPTPIQ